jgi:hypothetical protein
MGFDALFFAIGHGLLALTNTENDPDTLRIRPSQRSDTAKKYGFSRHLSSGNVKKNEISR